MNGQILVRVRSGFARPLNKRVNSQVFRRRYKLKWPERSFRTHAVVVCLLLSLIVGITGLPMPVSKSTNERFPCEKCPCGCRTAAHCWDKCCCHTDEEKLAWADANGVTPPVFLVQRVVAAKQTKLVAAKQSTPACCALKKNTAPAATSAAVQSAKPNSPTKKCSACAKPDAPTKTCAACAKRTDGKPKSDSTKTVRSLKLVLLDPYLQCNGSGRLWKLLRSIYVNTNIGLRLEYAHPLPEQRLVEDIFASNIVYWPEGPVPRYL